jgi:hypothetical protein
MFFPIISIGTKYKGKYFLATGNGMTGVQSAFEQWG